MNRVAPSWCSKYRKIPYKDKGRDFTGVDCYGLVVLVNRLEFGRTLVDYTYASSLDQDSVYQTIKGNLDRDWLRAARPEEGDMVMLKIKGRPWHCGLVVAEGLMLHAINGSLSGIDRLDRVRWEKRITGYHRPKVF